MRKRFDIWTWAGFFTAAVLGTLGHFAYDWSGKSLPVGAFCAVNESTWEHMKLLFFPVLLFTAVQLCLRWESGLLAARAVWRFRRCSIRIPACWGEPWTG